MKHEVILLTDDDYDLEDELRPEYDVDELRSRAKEAGFSSKGRLVWLESDVIAAFPDAAAINDALREVIAFRSQTANLSLPQHTS